MKTLPPYECSSKGDRRFSALYARLKDGRTIEAHYQCDVKGYEPGGTNWKLGKGKPPLRHYSSSDLFSDYAALWWRYFKLNPHLAIEIRKISETHNLFDSFGKGNMNQADAIKWLLEGGYI